MTTVAVAMLGARMHYAVPRLLHEAGLLDRFFTDSYVGNKPWLQAGLCALPAVLRSSAVERWLGRCEPALPPEKVTSFDLLGLWYGRARQRAKGAADTSEVFYQAAARFNRNILHVGLGDASVVWGFNGAALELFMVAKREGRCCVLEQTILPRSLERSLLRQEQLRWPGWDINPCDWSQQLAMDGREEAEWQLADVVVTGSAFVRDGLVELGVHPQKIHVIPYGVDPNRFEPPTYRSARSSNQQGPLKVLFAGEVGLRKGVPDLLEAVQQFSPAEIDLRLAGSISLHHSKLHRYHAHAQFLGAVPRSRMQDLFQWADVFVLPSILEGSATVIYEAVTAGCPVITTPNAGSIIQDGVDGFVVPIRSPERIAQALRMYIEKPHLLPVHKLALETSRHLASLNRYGHDLALMIAGFALDSDAAVYEAVVSVDE
jgi:glycosyltransferase involved in cell wall biosynthesis